MDLNVILLHEDMVDKTQKLVTTSLTMIDVHDLARSCRTYGVTTLYIAHPSAEIRSLAKTLKTHWEEGFGATYNPNRKDALAQVEIVSSVDEALMKLQTTRQALPRLISTSAKDGGKRATFAELRQTLHSEPGPFLLMLGTGWGMSENLLNRAEIFLEPIKGPTPYNHLSVRSACAIMLDRLCHP